MGDGGVEGRQRLLVGQARADAVGQLLDARVESPWHKRRREQLGHPFTVALTAIRSSKHRAGDKPFRLRPYRRVGLAAQSVYSVRQTHHLLGRRVVVYAVSGAVQRIAFSNPADAPTGP